MESFTRLCIKRRPLRLSCLTPVEILKGTLHSIKREARSGSGGFYHQSKPLTRRKAFTQKDSSWDLPRCELLALSSVLQVLVFIVRSFWELAEVARGGSFRE